MSLHPCWTQPLDHGNPSYGLGFEHLDRLYPRRIPSSPPDVPLVPSSEAGSSLDGSDPAPTFVTKLITRKEALEQAGDLVDMIDVLGFDQESLKPRMKEWLSEPVFRVLPRELKQRVTTWCHNHDDDLRSVIPRDLRHRDLTEWVWEAKIQDRRKDEVEFNLGADILRSYVADLKPPRKRLPETERRDVINKVRRGMSLFADYHDEKLKAMDRETQALLQKERETMGAEPSAFHTAFELQKQAVDD
ncbi:hypothetical protein NW762_014477 [Fusarium torreyae]|uniref:Uncharacterized protein n=1 Tax=Fusarium torreyae TaxID=1237075 RepID=A0A9W8RLB2_9HYPO|nr:hypothetical protein NW762_014477 [Fusarium torreyae]